MSESHRRLLTVLSSFTTETPRRTLSEVVRATDIPVSTAHRMLDDLVVAGVLVKDEKKRYVVGDRMWELGIQSPRARQIRIVVVPVLEELFLRTGLQVLVAGLAPNGQMIVEYTIGRDPRGRFGGVGQRLPLHAVSPGFVALAFGPERLRTETYAAALPQYTASTETDPAVLRVLTEDVLREGFAVSRGSLVEGTTSVSAPLLAPPLGFYGAVSIMWEGAENEERLTTLIVDAAAQISASLRGPRVR